jgi:hypothetical protein
MSFGRIFKSTLPLFSISQIIGSVRASPLYGEMWIYHKMLVSSIVHLDFFVLPLPIVDCSLLSIVDHFLARLPRGECPDSRVSPPRILL